MKLSELCHHVFCAIGLLTVFTTSRLCDVEELNVTSASYGMTDQVLLEITKHLLKLRKLQVRLLQDQLLAIIVAYI